jgi:NADH-quinone oxidoreductase subunit N
MTSGDILAILPLIIPAVTIVVLTLLIAFARSHVLTLIVATISLAGSLVAVIFGSGQQTHQVTQVLVVDGYARFYMGLIYAGALIACIQSYSYLKHTHTVREEYYVLLLAAALGSAVLAGATHFASLFVGIELLSLSLYVLIAYAGTGPNVEAGVKYFVLTAISIAFLLFGTALVYGASGTMTFQASSAVASSSNGPGPILFLAGTAMVMIGIGFKLALVPFNFWAPDVFQGAPAPVAGFLATVSKGAVFAVLMRYFSGIHILSHNALFYILAVMAIASMFFGNITALMQNNIKRVLAYSSIAHFGYLLLMVIAGGAIGIAASIFYLTAYFVTTLMAFGVITFLSGGETDLELIEDYKGLAFRHPILAICLTAAMLSLAGIPLTAGFIAKFYLVAAGAKMQLWVLLIILVINSVIGLFYYLRVTVALYSRTSEEEKPEPKQALLEPSPSWLGGVALAVLFLSLFFLGIWPGPVVQLILKVANL